MKPCQGAHLMVHACHHCHQSDLPGHNHDNMSIHMLKATANGGSCCLQKCSIALYLGMPKGKTLTHTTGGQYHRSTARLQGNGDK